MLKPETYRLKVVDGRKHVAICTYENAKVEHERCQKSLQRKQEALADPSNPQAIPVYNVQLKTCLLAEEEMLAAGAVVAHYTERLDDLENDQDVALEVAVLSGQTEY